MKVILLKDVPKVGNRHQIKDLKAGFAQNVLISQGLAIMATPKNIAMLANKKSDLDKKREEEKNIFEKLIAVLNTQKILIKVKANEKGHLFKAVNSKDIVEVIKNIFNLEIEEKWIFIDNIKEIGLHKVSIRKGEMESFFEIEVVSD